MEHPPPGPAPTDPYQWRESVLSTRSLSYISVMPDDHENPGLSSPRHSFSLLRNGSFALPNFIRRNTLMSISSLGEDEETLEMSQQRQRQPAPIQDNLSDGSRTPEPNSQPGTPQPEPQHPQQVLPDSIAHSPLFRLPPELRQIIWSYALSPSDPTLEIPWPSTHLHTHLQPQLLRACKAIHEESAEILYTTTNLSFAHPSDANMFRRALGSQDFALLLPHFTLKIKSSDAKLWTAWFNSNNSERSLVKDFPNLQSVMIRYSGLRYERRYTEEQNAHMWLKDPRLQEVVLSVRKCSILSRGGPPVVRVKLCVVLPEEIRTGLREGKVNPAQAAERVNSVIFVREAWLLGCFVQVEAVEKEGLWM